MARHTQQFDVNVEKSKTKNVFLGSPFCTITIKEEYNIKRQGKEAITGEEKQQFVIKNLGN